MTLIYESENFLVEAMNKPHVDRNDGGHIATTAWKESLASRFNIS